MEPQFQKTFIPKKPIASAAPVSTRQAVKKKKNFFGFISLIAFFAALLVAGGVFGYQQLIGRQMVAMKEELSRAVAELQDNFLARMITLDNRLKSAKEILSKHTATTPLFALIGQLTLPSVQFTEFTFAGDPNGTMNIDMRGTAPTYAAVALQSDIFAESPHLISPIFYDIGVNENGRIIFGFRAQVRTQSLLFSQTQ
jgi:hypothetical protein